MTSLGLAALLACSALATAEQAWARADRTASPVAGRTTIALGDDWRFRLGEDVRGAERPEFDDAGWETVSVPHTWNRVGYYKPNPERHLHTAANVDKRQGVGWYRLTFTSPAAAPGRRAWLQFDAASRTAEVWLNGVRLGAHEGGFSRFRFDATHALKPGEANVLAVKTDNSVPRTGAATANTFPLLGDFFIHGGLYRPVSLIVTDAVHIDLADFGGPGVYARNRSTGPEAAQVALTTRLTNDGRANARTTVSARLVDDAGRIVARAEAPAVLAPGSKRELAQVLEVAKPRLWQGIEDPYLYRLEVELRSSDGRLLDSLAQPLGLREMRLDPERGFILNGKPTRLHGVGLHQDREGKGWAVSAADVAETVAILREMGANTLRLTHYQHGQPIHDLADRHGLVLWDEIPVVTSWTLSAEQTEAPAGLLANARQQLQELIRQNYNHASVAVWGIANEVDFGPTRPDFLGVAPETLPDPLPLLRNLNALAKREDPNRPTVLATCCEERGQARIPVVAGVTDAVGVNRYFGWYYGQPAELGPHLDRLRALRPDQPLSVTEYGAGGATTIHTDDPRGGPADRSGPLQPEEYESWVHEESWRVLEQRPYLWATWLWNGFDFASTVRTEGDAQDINTKGLVTYDRKVRKDAFYFYRANWSSEPSVHIVGRRYVDRAYPATDVRVYSNAASTELIVAGRSLGAKAACDQNTCVWTGVRLRPGSNEVLAKGSFAGRPVEDRLVWDLTPTQARGYRIDSGTLAAAAASTGRFGSDAFFDGGSSGSTDQAGGRGRAPVFATIAATGDRDLVASFREGRFRYRLPLDNGRYKVTLRFVEPTSNAGERVFDVLANGKRSIAELDIAAASGRLTALERSFTAKVGNGFLMLDFVPQRGSAIVSAIEVSPL